MLHVSTLSLVNVHAIYTLIGQCVIPLALSLVNVVVAFDLIGCARYYVLLLLFLLLLLFSLIGGLLSVTVLIG